MDFNSNDRKIKDKERMSRVKKKIIALFLASLMVASSIPVPMVQAEVTAEETDSSTEGTFPADGEDIPPENENKEDEAIVQANTIMGQIDALMEAPLSREKYEAVKAAYDSASEDVIAYFDIEKANCFNQLHELMDSADKAVDAIELIQELKLNARETDYIVFAQAVEDAKVKVEAYYSKFSTLKQNAKYAACLLRDIRNDLIPNFSKYDRAALYLAVEEAYHDIGDFDVLTTEMKEKVQLLSDAVNEAGTSPY